MFAVLSKSVDEPCAAKRATRIGPTPILRRSPPLSERCPSDLLLIAAHDLRSPLAAAKLLTGRLSHLSRSGGQLSPNEIGLFSSKIARALDQAFTLIDDVLSTGCGVCGGAVAETVADVEEVIRDIIDLQGEALARVHCPVYVHRSRGLARAAHGGWSATHLRMIVSNLLRNVIRHAPGAPVTITLGRRRNCLRLVFADRGPGFTRSAAQTSMPGKHGYGLGLWIVEQAVRDLNGKMATSSRPGHGVSFDIEIPGLDS